MVEINRLGLDKSQQLQNIGNEDFKELKDTVSGLPSLMTRVSTNINDIKKPVGSSIDIGSNDYGNMDNNAVSARIVGLRQLNLTQKKQGRYDNFRFNSPSPGEMLNNQSEFSLSQSLGQNSKLKQETSTKQ